MQTLNALESTEREMAHIRLVDVSIRDGNQSIWGATGLKTALQFITTGFRFISWETADLEFMRLAYRTLVRNGIARFALIDPMHDQQSLLTGARMIREEGGEVLAGLTYTISDVHDDAFYARLAGGRAPP